MSYANDYLEDEENIQEGSVKELQSYYPHVYVYDLYAEVTESEDYYGDVPEMDEDFSDEWDHLEEEAYLDSKHKHRNLLANIRKAKVAEEDLEEEE